MVGRDNWKKNDHMSADLADRLRGLDVKIRWEDPAVGWIYKLRKAEERLKIIPEFLRNFNLRIVRKIYRLLHPDYSRYMRERSKGLESRCRYLEEIIAKEGEGNEIFILGYSSGGRAASLIADSLPVSRLICIGYPFQNPNEPPEPRRYEHLAGLRTPTLIIQGERDEYGGTEIQSEYRLSSNIEVFFVESDHGYKLSDGEWGKALPKIAKALDGRFDSTAARTAG